MRLSVSRSNPILEMQAKDEALSEINLVDHIGKATARSNRSDGGRRYYLPKKFNQNSLQFRKKHLMPHLQEICKNAGFTIKISHTTRLDFHSISSESAVLGRDYLWERTSQGENDNGKEVKHRKNFFFPIYFEAWYESCVPVNSNTCNSAIGLDNWTLLLLHQIQQKLIYTRWTKRWWSCCIEFNSICNWATLWRCSWPGEHLESNKENEGNTGKMYGCLMSTRGIGRILAEWNVRNFGKCRSYVNEKGERQITS